jgi:hypothetical protein
MKKGPSDETRAKISATNKSRMTDARREEISKITKARMADPAVRQRIQDGMRAASGEAIELHTLRAAWLAARPSARKRFLIEITNAESEG